MIKIVQFMPYLYLVLAILFGIDAVDKYNNGENFILQAFFAVLGIFMFFFRLRFAKKIKDQENKNK